MLNKIRKSKTTIKTRASNHKIKNTHTKTNKPKKKNHKQKNNHKKKKNTITNVMKKKQTK